jgi:hypothetical protein
MPLNYDHITIASSSNSQGKTHNDVYRCQYIIRSQAGDTYFAFEQKGATLRNLAIGTKLKIGWKFDGNKVGYQRKIIKWFKVLSMPKTTEYHCQTGTFSTQEIDSEYAKILQIMGK